MGYITPHTWDDAQRAWNDGRMDQWLPAKGRLGMGAYGPAELPFQTALADAFTLCEAYHCSMQAGTNPNRLFLWTGANDPRGEAGGPALVNTHDRLGPPPRAMPGPPIPNGCSRPAWTGASIRTWPTTSTTTPGRLSPIPRGACLGGDALRERALSTRTLQDLARDVAAGSLPQVSWIIAPAADSEHPEVSSPRAPTRNGCWTSSRATRRSGAAASSSSPTTRTTASTTTCRRRPTPRNDGARSGGLSTVELDGEYHDAHRPQRRHARRPAALHGRAFGMGPRVPMLVVSPWSRGGWVNAQVFDHTSVIRFLEARHGVMEPNISAWRRAVAGDLTSALDFSGERDHPDEPPGGHAIQTRRSCALPYALETVGRMTADGESYRLTFRNPGSAGAVLHVYDRLDLAAPPRHTLGAGSRLDDGWRLSARGDYGLWLLGPDGFHREFRGGAQDGGLLEAQLVPVSAGLRLRLINYGEAHQPMKVESRIGDGWRAVAHVQAGGAIELKYAGSEGWYDLEITVPDMPAFGRRLAGRIASGKPGVPDPRLRRGWTLTPWTGRD